MTSLHQIIHLVSTNKLPLMSIIGLLFWVSLSAQTTPGGLIAEDANPSLSLPEYIESNAIPSSKQTQLYEDLQVKKNPSLSQKRPYRASAIDRNYYINNPFEIEDLSNPFNLPKVGRKKILPNKNKGIEHVGKFFQTLFERQAPKDNPKNSTKPPAPLWFFFLLLGNLTFFTYLLRSYHEDFKKNLTSFFNPRSSAQQHREQKNNFSLFSVLSYALFGLSMGSFIFLINNQLNAAPNSTNTWSLSFLVLSIGGLWGLYLLKHLQLKVISMIFPFNQQVDYYNFLIANTNKLIGILLVPILFLCAYLPEQIQLLMVYGSLISLGLVYAYRTVQGVLSAREIIIFHKFHFFVYLCTVEVAPILILLKFLSII